MSTGVSAVYLHVVDAVVGKLREDFISEGIDDTVLGELQGLWELKMLQCGAIQGPIERNSTLRSAVPTPVRDLNVPYEGPEEYETPTAEMLFPPTPLQTPLQTPLPIASSPYQYFPSGSSEYASLPEAGTSVDGKTGRPAPYMPPPSPWMNQRPLGVDVNVAYDEAREEGGAQGGGGTGNGVSQPPTKDFFTLSAGKRKRNDYASHYLPDGYIPQQDGSADAVSDNSENGKEKLKNKERLLADAKIASIIKKQNFITIPQLDGYDDIYDDGVRQEDYNAPSYYDPLTPHNAGTPKPNKSEALEDDEPPLNEDDDDDLDDFDQGEEPNTTHLVLAQFEKVNRTKSRWKCTLKDGIMHLNNKDILFTKATGEFDF